MMGDRATLERIFAIMRRLLLVPMDGANPIPRKGTTRHECYRALYEIQELLETRGYSGKHLPQTNADRVRNMDDYDLAIFLENVSCKHADTESWLDWLRQEAKPCTK